MTTADLLRCRLYNQQLSHHSFKDITKMVAHLGALQAQDYAGAKWSVAMRMNDVTDADVEDAIEQKKIVRTWAMRGTWHFIAPADVRSILSVIAPRLASSLASMYKKMGLTDDVIAKSQSVIARTLKGGRSVTRKDLVASLEKNGVLTEGMHSNHLLLRAAIDGLICQGPRERKEFTFVLLDEWIPAVKEVEREKALAMLAQRFFTSHGPAALKDLSGWLGITITEAKAAIEACSSKLTQVVIDEKEYWMPKDQTLIKENAPTLLIHGFDEYLLGYKDRSEALDPAYTKRVIGNGNGLFSPTIILDGRVAGTWKRTLKKSEVLIEAEPFFTFTKKQKNEVEKEMERYAEFLGLKLNYTKLK